MKKWYVEFNAGGNGILIQNETKWIFIDESQFLISLDPYTRDGEYAPEKVLEKIRVQLQMAT